MRWRPRFSLLSLLLLSLTLGFGSMLWRKWYAWEIERSLPVVANEIHRFTPEARFLLNAKPIRGDWHSAPVECAVWDLQAGRHVSMFLSESAISELAITNDSKRAAAWTFVAMSKSDYSCRLQIWDAQTGNTITSSADDFGWGKMQFSADGVWVLRGKKMYRAENPADILVFGERTNPMRCFFDQAAASAYNNKLRLQREMATQAQTLKQYALAAPDENVTIVASPSGKCLLTSVEPGKVEVWDWVTQTRQAVIPLELNGVNSDRVLFFPNDERIAITQFSDDKSKRTQIVELAAGKVVTELSGEIQSGIRKEQLISLDGKRIVLSDNDVIDGTETHVSRIYDIDSSRELSKCRTDLYALCALSPDGQRLAAHDLQLGDAVNSAPCIFDAGSGELLEILPHPPPVGEKLLRFSPDGRKLITNAGGEVFVWRRNHPEQWWGVAALPEFWAAVVSLSLLLWSLRRDWKMLPRAQAAESV